MSKRSELSCWEIIQCNRRHKCLLASDEEKACWELAKEDRACSFHICVDCLVYLAKQDDSIFSDEEFCSILSQRSRERETKQTECRLAHELR